MSTQTTKQTEVAKTNTTGALPSLAKKDDCRSEIGVGAKPPYLKK